MAAQKLEVLLRCRSSLLSQPDISVRKRLANSIVFAGGGFGGAVISICLDALNQDVGPAWALRVWGLPSSPLAFRLPGPSRSASLLEWSASGRIELCLCGKKNYLRFLLVHTNSGKSCLWVGQSGCGYGHDIDQLGRRVSISCTPMERSWASRLSVQSCSTLAPWH
ncbi:uncharacterized protein BCR38DRAFT_183747 [Pseudomassariella vexata]|uniref:Uncharacterized protein n=1 Tax=Pseudomassariella vexata TaxID=1141098 RepID=A0A1Y2E5P2_9PEZI|nr:uncharacterized protein BCR38DRAFT_183747 [Pseudomassariella vexata]ORY66596.1 hypothetical protein BCR38DRAFT_183747 [Pseudomassariella vexata]